MSENIKDIHDNYGSKRVILSDYITDANQGFGFEGQAYISTSDENLFFRCSDGELVDITKKKCPFRTDSLVYPNEVHFSLTTPDKYLKKKKVTE